MIAAKSFPQQNVVTQTVSLRASITAEWAQTNSLRYRGPRSVSFSPG